jgi:DNA-binding NarL/FixJ family response regulator
VADFEQSEIWASYPQGRVRGGHRAAGGTLRLLLVSADPKYGENLRAAFDPETGIELAGEAGSASEAIEQARVLKPDIVVIDVDAPEIESIEVMRKLAGDQPGVDVVALSAGLDKERLHEARHAGASAFVVKDAAAEVLLQTLKELTSGEGFTPQQEGAAPGPAPASEVEGPGPPAPDTAPASPALEPEFQDDLPARPDSLRTDYLLTANERAILRLLAEGLNNDQIGYQTGLQKSMVRTYLSEIYRKLGLSGRDDAMQYARERLGTDEC